MMSQLRDAILAAKDLREETVDVPEWGVKVTLVGMSAMERGRMVEAVTDKMYLTTDIVLNMARHPETGEPLFDKADRDALAGKSGGVLDRLAQKVLELSGVDVGQAEKEVAADPT